MIATILIAALAVAAAVGITLALLFRSKLTSQNALVDSLTAANRQLEIDSRVLDERLQAQLVQVSAIQEQMKVTFENTMTKIVDERSDRINVTNIRQVEETLRPYKELLDQFRADATRIQTQYTAQSTSVTEHIKILAEKTNSVGDRAENLARALTDNSKLRGNWGEMTLVSLLELAGLNKDVHYSVQVATRGQDDRHSLLADVVITMPEGRQVVVDSKVSLVAYQRMVSATNDADRSAALKEHVAAMKNCVDSLSRKGYHHKIEAAANFTLMFTPIEPAYFAAVSSDSGLWQYAYDRGVMIVSATTLLPTLRIISDMWRQDRLNSDVGKIVDRGEKLYAKVSSFLDSFYKVGKSLDSASSVFETAKGQLETGVGNVKWQATELRKLGLKTKNRIEGVEDGAAEEVIDEQMTTLMTDSEASA